MAEFLMPSLGADMESGTLVKWHVKPGDVVKRSDVIAEVETDKGLIEIECFESGVVDQLRTEPGAKVPVGTVMAVIRGEGEIAKPKVEIATPPLKKDATTPVTTSEAPHVHASPLAKKIAAERGVDLRKLTGTGPGGLIDHEDVERAVAAARTPEPVERARMKVSPLARRLAAERGIDLTSITPGPTGIIEQADLAGAAAPALPGPAPAARQGEGMRRAIAAAMAKSKRDIPHYYLQTRIDMSVALKWLEAENAKRCIKDRLLPAVLLLKAVAKALGDVPALNGFWIDGEHRISHPIHLGLAVAMKGGGLVAPAIHDIGEMTCDELMATLRDLIPRARAGRLRSSEMTDATLTVTSLGDLGVETVFGVIYPPQVAIVGFGKIMEQPWAKDGMLGVHPVMTASLAADHRATDGHTGAQFLEALNQHFQTPESL